MPSSIPFTALARGSRRELRGVVKKVYTKQRKLEWVWGALEGIEDPEDPLYWLTEFHWMNVQYWQIELLKQVAWRSGPRVTLPSSLCAPVFSKPIPVARTGSELFCGSAHLSTSLEKEGYAMRRYDRKEPGVAGSCNVEWDALSADTLRWLFGVTVVHMSPDCSTFSQLATSYHRRKVCNDFLGVSAQARVANGHLVKLFDALRARVLAPRSPLVFTVENPEATFEHHAFSTEVCRPVAAGGCGGRLVRVSFCAFGARVRKNTVFLTNSPTLQSLAGKGQFYCGHTRRCAFHQQMHECVTVRNKVAKKKVVASGHATSDVTAFPLPMTEFVAKAIDVDVSILSGSFERCGNTQCAFAGGHRGLCSHMMVTARRGSKKKPQSI